MSLSRILPLVEGLGKFILQARNSENYNNIDHNKWKTQKWEKIDLQGHDKRQTEFVKEW